MPSDADYYQQCIMETPQLWPDFNGPCCALACMRKGDGGRGHEL